MELSKCIYCRAPETPVVEHVSALINQIWKCGTITDHGGGVSRSEKCREVEMVIKEREIW